MIINLELDSNAQAAPANIQAAWTTAANMYASMFTDNITINISVDWSGTGGGASGSPSNSQLVNYQNVYNLLTSDASPGDSSFASLPNATSINGQTQVVVWSAEEKALGLLG